MTHHSRTHRKIAENKSQRIERIERIENKFQRIDPITVAMTYGYGTPDLRVRADRLSLFCGCNLAESLRVFEAPTLGTLGSKRWATWDGMCFVLGLTELRLANSRIS
jgi:hypothetical protein